MFNIGFGELAIICIVLIIAVGPERLPSMMKTLGKTIRTLRQASRDIRASTGIDELLREDFDLYSPPAPSRRPAYVPPAPDAAAPAAVSRQDPLELPAHTPAAAAPSEPEPAPVTAALLGGAAPQQASTGAATETSSTRAAQPDTGREPTGHWHPALAPADPGVLNGQAPPLAQVPDAPAAPAAGPHPDQPKQPGT